MPHDPSICAFCGRGPSTHRIEDTILSRFLAGEGLASILWDYGYLRPEEEVIIHRVLQKCDGELRAAIQRKLTKEA